MSITYDAAQYTITEELQTFHLDLSRLVTQVNTFLSDNPFLAEELRYSDDPPLGDLIFLLEETFGENVAFHHLALYEVLDFILGLEMWLD